jgi:hypothetical protein
MKKVLFLTIVIGVLFGFELNKTYSCETLGVNIKKGKNIVSIPNSIKTYKQLKQSLKDLYSIKIKPLKKQMAVYVGDKNDTLDFVKTLDKNVNLYKTKTSDLFILTDSKTSQIGIEIPTQKMIIYYQCR